jgi:hypothetical protein
MFRRDVITPSFKLADKYLSFFKEDELKITTPKL